MDPAALERGFEAALTVAGRIDVLVNNGHEAEANDWTTVTAEQFTRQLANATGYFLLARQVRNHAVERGSAASIILLGSMYGQVGSYPDAYEGVCPASPVAYHALKGGIIQMTRHLAAYWAADRVRVNCLSPGPFPKASAPDTMVERLSTKLPMKRMGQPHELKGAIVFLASDASSFMTGQNLTIDGGWTAW
jgi:gluconate 5-dehydrogenase